ncbi:MAG: radical SAM protein [Candidatus Hodarchaeota archaeon]
MMQVITDKDKCINCGYCREAIACAGENSCTGCGACVDACPQNARHLIKIEEEITTVNCVIDGCKVQVPGKGTVLKVLESLGYSITRFPESNSIFAPCRTGSCWSCAVLINERLAPSCITSIQEGMIIQTKVEQETPRRLVSGFQPHMVGGVGTPKNLVSSSSMGYLEVACFAAGCLYRCSTCQNWQLTYSSRRHPSLPEEAAHRLTTIRKRYRVDRMAISGGESTLNRNWLVNFVRALKKNNPDEQARIHVDTNAAILTSDYIDELIEAGMTDIGPDLKGIHLDTFMKITQIYNKPLAQKYLETSWNAVKYILDTYMDSLFLGIGIPYNRALISLEEVQEIGQSLERLSPDIQVTVLDYRPEFRAQYLERPSYQEMIEVKEILNAVGLKQVICQTTQGHIR